MSGNLPPSLLEFIRVCVPTYQAAEVLVFLAADRDREFTVDELVLAMRPTAITAPAVRQYVEHFAAAGLISVSGSRFRYGPRTAELEHGIGELVHAYNEKPVTLIKAIYRIADSHIRSFADSFKLRDGNE